MTTPSPTPNVIVENPAIRKGANIVLGVVGILVGATIVFDVASPAVDLSEITTPVTAVYGFLAGVFGLAVTTPNVPTKTRV
jgi:hypothetical protein